MLTEDTAHCGLCRKLLDWNEYVINFGICDMCFNESYEQYLEENAGPFDWLGVIV